MEKSFSNSLRESILEEKNKTYNTDTIANLKQQNSLFNESDKNCNDNAKNNEIDHQSGMPFKTVLMAHKELQESCYGVLQNLQADLTNYITNLPLDGNLSQITKVNLSYIELLHKRNNEILEKHAKFCRELMSSIYNL